MKIKELVELLQKFPEFMECGIQFHYYTDMGECDAVEIKRISFEDIGGNPMLVFYI